MLAPPGDGAAAVVGGMSAALVHGLVNKKQRRASCARPFPCMTTVRLWDRRSCGDMRGPHGFCQGSMFDRIAFAYDKTNKFLSIGLDQRWRNALARCRAQSRGGGTRRPSSIVLLSSLLWLLLSPCGGVVRRLEEQRASKVRRCIRKASWSSGEASGATGRSSFLFCPCEARCWLPDRSTPSTVPGPPSKACERHNSRRP